MFLTRSLNVGGAERQLVLLSTALHRQGIAVRVLSLYGGTLEVELRNAGVQVEALGKRSRWDVLGFFLRFRKALLDYRPDVVYGFLPVPNILAVLAKRLRPGLKVIWGVRASDMDLTKYDYAWKWVDRLQRVLSRFADRIVANSHAGRDHHVKRGFPADKMIVIPNGIDTERFRFSAQGRERMRAQWGLSEAHLVIGIVARLDPAKGYETFLQAGALLAKRHPSVRFVCVGDGSARYREKLRTLAEDLGIADSVIWAGSRDDVPDVCSAFDVVCSASYTEGFSNAIGEAMSCERPCVVTDAGDSAWILGEPDRVVPPRDASALAAACERVIAAGTQARTAMGVSGRARIVEHASVEALVARTRALLES